MVEQAQRVPQPSPGAGEYLERAMAWSDEVRLRARVAQDLPYGDDERQKLDIYMPDDERHAPAPVLLFFHGGYWVIGHKDLLGFMAPAITTAPALLVPVGYRLAPGAKYPQQVDDCRTALRWVHDNIARLRRRFVAHLRWRALRRRSSGCDDRPAARSLWRMPVFPWT